MRNPAGEKAKLLERLRLAPFRLVSLPLGDVAEDQDNSDNLVFVIPNR